MSQWQISSFLNDFASALSRAKALDAKIKADAEKISSDYASIVALSVRQTLGACEITVSKNADGSFNTNDITTFMKEISSDGVSFRKMVSCHSELTHRTPEHEHSGRDLPVLATLPLYEPCHRKAAASPALRVSS